MVLFKYRITVFLCTNKIPDHKRGVQTEFWASDDEQAVAFINLTYPTLIKLERILLYSTNSRNYVKLC